MEIVLRGVENASIVGVISHRWREGEEVSRSKAQYLLENEPVISGHIIIEINDSRCTCLAFEMDTRWHAVWLSQTRFIDSPSDICFSAGSLASFSNGCVITNGYLLTVVIPRSIPPPPPPSLFALIPSSYLFSKQESNLRQSSFHKSPPLLPNSFSLSFSLSLETVF